MEISDPITEIPGIGNKYATLLKQLNIKTVEDLLWHVPFRYEDSSNIKKITELTANENATVIGEVTKIDNIFTGRFKKLTRAVIQDETGKLNILWFNQHYIKKALPIGTIISVSGSLNPKEKQPQFLSPSWEIVKSNQLLHTGGLIPVYSTTDGLTNKWFRTKIKEVLGNIFIQNTIPESVLAENNLLDKQEAIEQIHFPIEEEIIQKAKYTLAFEELLFLHLYGLRLQTKWKSKKNSHFIKLDEKWKRQFTKSLPFELTTAQKKSVDEILSDLEKESPMNRLLQGDVGSGKTIVAAYAILGAFKSGFNTILMAPTQILAEQHYKTLKDVFKYHNIKIKLIVSNNKKDISDILEHDDKGNKADNYLIVGTHAILHNLEKFSNIGLIIIDEQHKFGVSQRSKVVNYYSEILAPNLLTMTATPIPRTLALTFYGGLNLSVIDQMPKKRKIVKTWVIKEEKRKASYEWIKNEIAKNNTQVFIVCPFIEPSQVENLQNVKAAQEEYDKLVKEFKDFKVGLLHGQLKNEEKESILNTFKKQEIDILVTTPVIEVGIDIPNANIIVIETPERFGLASLHQLRGRVGRGEKQGYCILITSSNEYSGYQRLKNLEHTHKGNELAEIDLKIRGPGNLYGYEQHGFMDTKVAEITDYKLIEVTKSYAKDILQNIDKYPIINEKLKEIEEVSQS